MMETMQPTLFDTLPPMPRGRARKVDPSTSVAAAERVDAGRLMRLCLAALANAPLGLTNDEIATITGLPLNSTSPRSAQMKRKGWVIDSGIRRATRTGSKAIVWRVTAAGRCELERMNDAR